MRVCIAEKPSVAKEIAEVLGAKVRRNGYFEGNDYCVTWTFGHLCSLQEPHEYTEKWRQWNLSMLPMIPSSFRIKLIDDDGIKRQFAIIEELFNRAEMVINCGDAGQEGELIQRWVLTKAKCKAPVMRLWISSLTEEAIRDGFAKLMSSKDFDTLREREERVVDRASTDPDVGTDCRSAESDRAIQAGNLLGGADGLPGRLVLLHERTFHCKGGGRGFHAGNSTFGVGNQECGA